MSQELVALIVHNLVADNDAVEISSTSEGRGVRIEIRCAREDAGRVIGRGGRVINGIRTLARAAADGRQRVEVQLLE
ncbi:MAG TPA: KH domain-containing protein [Deinococcales bacterium]|nr:KH domain-containing protein [Deinococcales bacterium]